MDLPGEEPLHPLSRIALSAFTHCMVVFQSLACLMGHETDPQVTTWKLTLAANGLTAPTRAAVMNTIACVTVNCQIQADWPSPFSLTLAAFGSQPNESAFGEVRSPISLQNSGPASVGDIVRFLPQIAMTNEDVAKGDLIIPASRKAGNHVMHEPKKYVHRVTRHDMKMGLKFGEDMARRFLKILGYDPLLKKFKSLGAATLEYLERICPGSPKARTTLCTNASKY